MNQELEKVELQKTEEKRSKDVRNKGKFEGKETIKKAFNKLQTHCHKTILKK